MTEMFTAGPSPQEATADALHDALIKENIPVHVIVGQQCATITLWPHLVVFTDGSRIWWKDRRLSTRGQDLWTFARWPTTAAARLVKEYLEAATANREPHWKATLALAVLGPDEAQEAMRAGGPDPEVKA